MIKNKALDDSFRVGIVIFTSVIFGTLFGAFSAGTGADKGAILRLTFD